MENLVSVFEYNNVPVTFRTDNGTLMVNATEMAKSFGKTTKDWLRTQQTKDFISSLSAVRHICLTQLVIVRQGNSSSFEQGTWMHEDIALEFARWLSPTFAIWCNDRIKELLTIGMTATQPTLEQMINDPELVIGMATKLKEQQKLNHTLNTQMRTYQSEHKRLLRERDKLMPKVEYHDTVISSKGCLTINMIAASLNITDIRLNKLLCEWGVQYKQSGTYFLFAKYRDKGYTVHKPHPYTDSTGEVKTRQHMYWTEAGKKFIIEQYNNKTKN